MEKFYTFRVQDLSDLGSDPEMRDAAWRSFHAHFDPRLRDYFSRRVGNEAALDELLSDLWRRVLLGIQKLESARAAWSWMLTIGVNLLRSTGRSRQRAERRVAEFAHELDEDASHCFIERTDENGMDDARVVEVERRIALLPAQDRELIRLFAVEELSHIEIAKRLGLASAGACRQRLRRIRVAVSGGADD